MFACRYSLLLRLSVRWGTFMFVIEDLCFCAASERAQLETRTTQKYSRSIFAVTILLACNPFAVRAQTNDTAPGRNISAHAIAQQFAQPAAAAPSLETAPGNGAAGNGVPVVRYQANDVGNNGAGESTSGAAEARLSFVPREDFLWTTAATPPVAMPPVPPPDVSAVPPVTADIATPPPEIEREHVAAVEPEPAAAVKPAVVNVKPVEADDGAAATPVVKRKVKPAAAANAEDDAEPEPVKPKRLRVHKRKIVKAPVVEEKVVAKPRQPQPQLQGQRKAVQPPDDDEQEQAEVKNRAPVRRQVQTLAPASNGDQPSALSNLGTKILSTLGLIPSEPGVPAQLDWDKRQQ